MRFSIDQPVTIKEINKNHKLSSDILRLLPYSNVNLFEKRTDSKNYKYIKLIKRVIDRNQISDQTIY